jgi:hypothetical protein
MALSGLYPFFLALFPFPPFLTFSSYVFSFGFASTSLFFCTSLIFISGDYAF